MLHCNILLQPFIKSNEMNKLMTKFEDYILQAKVRRTQEGLQIKKVQILRKLKEKKKREVKFLK